ncbi:MAG: glycosyltransferase 87 family protein [Paracoccaceae bacterium]
MNSSNNRLVAAILLAGFGLSFYWFFPTHSPDLMATWLAGQFLTAGQPDQVYPAVTDTFLMYPPSEWRDFMAREYQYEGAIYPFIYPPIWAKLGQFIAEVNFWRVAAVALMVNCILLIATPYLAYRATRSQLNPAIFMGLAIFILLSTHIGTIALNQNQPQILVSFLLVLSVERIRANASIVAGLALAIAAAIKIYPAIFALFWLFGHQRRAFWSFLLFGTALGLTSLIWADWPLHRAFFDQISLISDTVLVTAISFNVDAAIAQLFFTDDLIWVAGLEPPTASVPDPGWYNIARPALWRMVSNGIFIAVFALIIRAFSRTTPDIQTATLWPLALILMALLSPISWVYYYIPAACFAPVLIDRLGAKLGTLYLTLCFGPIFRPILRLYRFDMQDQMRANLDLEGIPPYHYQLIGVAAFLVLATGFAYAAWRSHFGVKPPA